MSEKKSVFRLVLAPGVAERWEAERALKARSTAAHLREAARLKTSEIEGRQPLGAAELYLRENLDLPGRAAATLAAFDAAEARRRAAALRRPRPVVTGPDAPGFIRGQWQGGGGGTTR